jgi:hypothetical protein
VGYISLFIIMGTFSFLLFCVYYVVSMLGGFPVTMAWLILGLGMEERPPTIEGSCEYTE